MLSLWTAPMGIRNMIVSLPFVIWLLNCPSNGEAFNEKRPEKSDYPSWPMKGTDLIVQCDDYSCSERSDSQELNSDKLIGSPGKILKVMRDEPAPLSQSHLLYQDPGRLSLDNLEFDSSLGNGLVEIFEDCNDDLCRARDGPKSGLRFKPTIRLSRVLKRDDFLDSWRLGDADKSNFRFRFRNVPEVNGFRTFDKKSGNPREFKLKNSLPSRQIRNDGERYLMWRKITG